MKETFKLPQMLFQISINDFFDIRTLSLITGIVSISIFSCMLFVALKRKIYPGFIEWTIGSLSNSIGTILLSMRDFLPNFVTIVIANNLILIFHILIARGIAKFSGNSQKWWIDLIPPIFLTITFILFTYPFPNVNYRILIISFFLFVYCVRINYLVFKKLPSIINEKPLFLFIMVLILGGWHAFRLFLTFFTEDTITNFMNAGFIHGIAFIDVILFNIIVSIHLIIFNSIRLEIDLQKANKEIKTLSGLIPICSNCKKIRNDQGYWEILENYITEHSDALFSHGLCPKCFEIAHDEIEKINQNKN